MKSAIICLGAFFVLQCPGQVPSDSPCATPQKAERDTQPPLVVEIEITIIDVTTTLHRKLLESVVAVSDYSPILRDLRQRASEESVNIVQQGTVSTRSGTEATLHLTQQFDHPRIHWNKDGKGYSVETVTSEYGTVLVVEPVLDWDNKYLNLRYKISHDTEKPRIRKVDIRDGDGKSLKPSILWKNTKNIQSQSVVLVGGTVLVSTFSHAPPDINGQSMERMVFLSGRILKQ